MKKQGMGGSAFFVGVGWLGLPAGAVWVLPCRPPTGSCRASRADRLHEGKYRVEWCADRLHEKEYYTAFLWVAIIKRKVCQRETLKNVA
jgi:hypothetical protein